MDQAHDAVTSYAGFTEIVSSQKSEEKNIFFFQFRASKAVLQTALCGP
jgi:uncharacterized protein YktA (UPF0223 family)